MSQSESTTPAKTSFSPDWFVRGILTKLGEAFDRFTGRNWKPSSNLATSQLIEKLKMLLDAEAKDLGENRKVVPHHIKLKIQWDKFSADAADSLKKLEVELLTAAIDHINDRRYHTYAPMNFEVKPDYFTDGVKLTASFDKFAVETEDEPEEVNVTVPDLKHIVIPAPETETVEPEKEVFVASFTVNNQPKRITLVFSTKERKSVGRTKENDLWINDLSVSKLHAALVLNDEGQLMVADTGSTNGTFVGGVRIAYGKAIALVDSDKLRFGTVDVELKRVLKDNAEDQSAVQVAEEDFAANINSSGVESVRLDNKNTTSDISSSVNADSLASEINSSHRDFDEIIPTATTAEIFEGKNDSVKPREDNAAAALENEKPAKEAKDE